MRKVKRQPIGILAFTIEEFDMFQLLHYYYQMKQIIALLCLLLVVSGSNGNKPVYTQVTCLYDIKRGELANQFQRPFDYYLKHFEQLLKTQMNLIVFGAKQLAEFVWKRRSPTNTIFIVKELQTFKDHWYYPYVQRLRQKRLQQPNFFKKTHPQYSLQYYNMVVMYKTYMLDIAMKHDTFNTDFVAWTDGGLTHVTSDTVLRPDSHLMKWFSVFQPQWVFFTYLDNQPSFFDGYDRGPQRYLDGKTMGLNEGILSGFFGGYVEAVRDVSTVFENLLRLTLENGDMNSEEHVLSIMPFRYPLLIPTTCHTQFGGFNSKLHLHLDFLRKPEHPRFFNLSFDNQDERFHFHSDFLVIPEHPRLVKPTSESQQNKEKQQVQKPLPIIEVVKEKKQQCVLPKSTSENEDNKKKQQGIMGQFLRNNISGYKRILFRELLFLALLIIIEVAILRNRCTQRQDKNMSLPIPNRQPYLASITIMNNQQGE